jgi:hypothetical protein
MTTELIPTSGGTVAAVDPLADLRAFLRLHTAEGDLRGLAGRNWTPSPGS